MFANTGNLKNSLVKQQEPSKAGLVSSVSNPTFSNRLASYTEAVALLYIIITAIIALFMRDSLPQFDRILIARVEILLGMAVLAYIHYRVRSRLTWALRIIFQLLLLSYWYPETFEFNQHFNNLDHHFANVEQFLFGGQPALWLSQTFDHWMVSEPLHFAYFIYYALIVGVILFYYISSYKQAERVTFVIFGSFYLFYLVYIFLPVVGPQYYFPAIGWDLVAVGDYVPVGKYFATHSELHEMPVKHQGLFYQLVNMSQQMGERPTAAFPSSHVGITTIIFAFFYRGSKRLFWTLLPIYIMLCIATVYIQAHYLIDVFAGMLVGWLFYYFGNKLYSMLNPYVEASIDRYSKKT